MTVYAIGDIQGCYQPFCHLLDTLNFDSQRDQLWLCGDLVNRGPQSLAVLRFLRELGDAAVCVLGNHDLTLLAVAEGFVKIRAKDTFQEILDAPDGADLITWLRQRPLLHHAQGYTMVHAGLAPQWDLATAKACAAELTTVLRGPRYRDFLAVMFGQEPRRWHDGLSGHDRLRCIANTFTRMRYCSSEGDLDFSCKGQPGTQSDDLMPWFQVPERRNSELKIIFGHWATLGYYRAPGIYALDSGCVWGKQLTALNLDDESIMQVTC